MAESRDISGRTRVRAVRKKDGSGSERGPVKRREKAADAQPGRLIVLFTKSGFKVDRTGGEPQDPYEAGLKRRFLEDPWSALYAMGFEEKRSAGRDTASIAYLRRVSEEFVRTLTDIPELEILREEVRPEPSEETLEELFLAVPFGIGTEYITPAWIRGIFARLGEVFSREIGSYEGTVRLYLTEKSQQLRVPERVFFHLVA